jgi:hypothetical protein
MPSSCTFYPFVGRPVNVFASDTYPFRVLAESLAESDEADVELYRLVEYFTDEDTIEVVTFDGEPIGVLNYPVSRDEFAKFSPEINPLDGAYG